jgi:uncharacterized phage-associated protein
MNLKRNAYNPDLNEPKLANAILYFVNDPEIRDLGKTKLMKLLYYADFDHYEQHDESITGARYIRLDHGPVPNDAWAMIDRMILSGDLTQSKVALGAFDRFSYSASREFDPSVFAPEELETIQSVASRFKSFSTTQIEMATHGEAPWLAVKPNQIIPYHLTYYRNNYGEMDLDDERTDPHERLTEDDIFAADLPF